MEHVYNKSIIIAGYYSPQVSEKNSRPALAEIHSEGDSKNVLASFAEGPRGDLDFALFELQQGRQPLIETRRMESIGAGVYESKKRTSGHGIELSTFRRSAT